MIETETSPGLELASGFAVTPRNPFFIEGPALISFSGGRTSGYMLRRILDVGLQPDVHVVFADTGKERRETYDFVREVERRWDVSVSWVHRAGYFTQLITDKQMPPNTLTRYCTTELKLKPKWTFARSLGWDHWTNAIGLRADEPKRRLTLAARSPSFEDCCFPLGEAAVTRDDVMTFWKAQPFDLRLEPHESNCDLCFLKGQGKRIRIMQDQPELAQWWIDQEQRTHGWFRAPPRPNYTRLLQIASQPRLFDPNEADDLSDCICGD